MERFDGAVGFVSVARADFDDGATTYKQGDSAAAFKEFKTLTEQGDADSQYNLAVMYRDGLGVAPDMEVSMQWFREAAANGDPVSIGIVAQYEENRSPEPVTELE